MALIAVDIGYGQVKAVSANGQSILFPSIVGNGFTRTLKNTFKTDQNTDATNRLDVIIRANQGEQHVFLGELAETESRDASYAFADNKINHPNTIALLAVASALLYDGKEPVDIATGLPMQDFAAQRDLLQNALEGQTYSVEFLDGPYAGTSRTMTIKRAWIYPQGGAALFWALADGANNSIPLDKLDGLVGLVDVGFKTTDYVVMDLDRDGRFVESLSGGMSTGVHTAYLEIATAVKNQLALNLDLKQINRAARQNVLKVRGQRLELTSVIQRAYANVAQAILDELDVQWGNRLNEFSAILVAGGGGAALWPWLQKLQPQAILLPSPEFANAQGYLSAARLASKNVR